MITGCRRHLNKPGDNTFVRNLLLKIKNDDGNITKEQGQCPPNKQTQ